LAGSRAASHRTRLAPLIPLLVALQLACAAGSDRPEVAYQAALEEGEETLAVGETEEALTAFSDAVALRPASFDARHGRAQALLELGRSSEALAEFNWLSGHYPESFEASARRGYCRALVSAVEGWLEQGETRPAAGALGGRTAVGCGRVQLAPLRARTSYQNGLVAVRRGQVEVALRLFAEAERLDPAVPAAERSRAELLLQQGRREEAIDSLIDSLERHPDDRPLQRLMLRALSLR
jgi:tetratricopeptide (TPR) repeat protein